MANIPSETVAELADAALARSKIYGFFALIFRSEPREELIQQLKLPQVSKEMSGLGIHLGAEFSNTKNKQLLEDLAVEFTRLFIGPGPHISPHESVHVEYACVEECTLMGPETVAVKRFIEATGLNYREEFHGLPDHISAELELMQKLTEREGEAWSEDDQEDAVGIKQIQKQFLNEHIVLWVPRLCDKIIEQAELPYFKEIAAALKEFIYFEHDSQIHQEIDIKTA